MATVIIVATTLAVCVSAHADRNVVLQLVPLQLKDILYHCFDRHSMVAMYIWVWLLVCPLGVVLGV